MAEGTKYAQNARFIGRKVVQGPLNDIGLSMVVSDLQREARKLPSAEELRCNLEFSDRHLLITYIKKDEGFESDGESTKSAEATNSTGNAASVEVKIIKDHVFKLNSNDQSSLDDSSSANSSGSDTDDPAKMSSANNSPGSSASTSPTADLHKYKFDHKDSYPINDVLICHTAGGAGTANCVVWVIRGKEGNLEAMVFECFSEDDVKHLYRKFLDVSKRSKLERHRRRKSDGGSVVARSVEAIFNRAARRDKSNEQIEATTAGQSRQPVPLTASNLNKWSLVQHTDRNGITHIEVESSQPSSLNSSEPSPGFRGGAPEGPQQQQHQQMMAKLRSSRSSATPGKKPSEKSKFAKELESILSKELETRQHQNRPAVASGEPSSKGHHHRTRPPGESLSLRQRAPALLLRKLDEFEEKAQKVWAKAEADEENRKVWNKPTVVINNPSKAASRTPPPSTKNRHHLMRSDRDSQRKERLTRIKAELLQQKSTEDLLLGSPKPSVTSRPKIPMIPYIPPIQSSNPVPQTPSSSSYHHHHHQQSTTNSPVISVAASTTTTTTTTVTTTMTSSSQQQQQQQQQQQTVPNKQEKQILIPTKTGKEPVRKLYPKDQAPEFLHRPPPPPMAGRFVVALPSPMQFTAQQFSPQPHSLPLYPLQVAPIAWARYPTAVPAAAGGVVAPATSEYNDPNNNMNQLIQAQWAVAAAVQRSQPQAPPDVGGRGRSRDRSRVDNDQRRRAQSKSPARRPTNINVNVSNKYLDSMTGIHAPDMSGLSRKFREFGDAVRQKMSRGNNKGSNFTMTTAGADALDGGAQLKSNLKKNNVDNPAEVAMPHGSNNSSNNHDNKKVHFNKFATVQMME